MNDSDELQAIWEGYDGSIKKNNPTYSGLLGLTIDGEQQVEHATRNGFVYFRFRDNLSEVVLAFNDKVSPVYGLPVVVERVGNNWRVIGRDTDRYSNWGSSAPYLPKHGFQHSFDRDAGTGGDVVLVYPDQFIPLLVYPSGTFGAGNLQVGPYLLQRDDDFIYVGNTGTANILPYKPTSSSAIMGLVYLDRTTGNPGFLINSGTSFNATITGTASVSPYIPYPSSTQEPLYAFRLVSGTESLRWENLYNARQFIGGGQGGSSMITGGYMDLTTNQVAFGIKRFADNIQVGIEPPALNTTGTISQASEGVGAGNISWTWATGTASFMTGVLARGSKASPSAVQKDDILFRWRGRAHDGSTYGSTSVEIRGVADENHNSSGHGTRLEIWTTPTGTTTLTKSMTVEQGGNINIEAGKTYNVNNVPVSGGGGTVPHPPEGRLTLLSNTPVMISDLHSGTFVYYTPYRGDLYPSYDGSEWTERTIPQLTLALDSDSGHTGYHQSGKNFDFFLYNDGGTDRLGTGPAWTGDTARGTGAGTTELEYKNGIRTNKNSMTLRFGSANGDTVTVAANRGTYVGSFRTSANGQTNWIYGGLAAGGKAASFLLWNAYNKIYVVTMVADNTNSWTYASNPPVWRAANASNTMRISFMAGEEEDGFTADYSGAASGSTGAGWGVGFDSTTAFSGAVAYTQIASLVIGTAAKDVKKALGFHYFQAIENNMNVGTATYYGDVGVNYFQSGFFFSGWF